MNAFDYAKEVSELFAIPKTAEQVKRLIDDDKADMESISKIVSSDPGLAMHIMKISNSAIYRFPRKIETVVRAIQVIGTSSVYDYALIFGISNAMGQDQSKFINLDKFWEQSVVCALLNRYFASQLGTKDVDRLFLAGLLHNVGELVLLKVSPEIAGVCSEAAKGELPSQVQHKELGFTCAEISSALALQWALPDSLSSIIAMQHQDGTPADSIEAQIMQLSYAMSLAATYPEKYKFKQVVEPFLYECLHFSVDAIDESLDSATYEVEQIIHLFNPDVFKAA